MSVTYILSFNHQQKSVGQVTDTYQWKFSHHVGSVGKVVHINLNFYGRILCLFFFNLELKTKSRTGLLHPCLLLNLLSPICLSSFSLLDVGLVTYYSAEWLLMNNHFIVLHVGDFEMASQKVFSVWIYMVNHYLLLSPPSTNIGPGKSFVELCRMSEGA